MLTTLGQGLARGIVGAGAAMLLGALLGCGAAPPAPVAAAVVEAEEERLLRPFRTARVVVAHSVDVTLSPNFVGSPVGDAAIERFGTTAANRVALPAIDKNLHERRTVRDRDGVVETFLNKLGGVDRSLRLVVGDTQFQALQAITVRVLPSGATMTLDVVARGDVTVLAGSEAVDVPQVEIKDGVWRGQ